MDDLVRLFFARSRFGLFLALVTLAGCGGSTEPPVATQPPALPIESSERADQSPAPPAKTPAPEKPPPPVVPVETTPAPVEEVPVVQRAKQLASKLALNEAGRWKIDDEVRDQLSELGEEGIDALVALLEDPSVDARRGAAFFLLGGFNARRPDMVEGFLKLLSDDDRAIRGLGLQAAVKMRKEDRTGALDAIAALLDPERESDANRRIALSLLSEMGADAQSAGERVAAMATEEKTPTMRSAALAACVKICEINAAVSTLRKGLKDSDLGVRKAALAQLHALGPQAEFAASDLADLFGDENKDLREKATEAVVRIGSPSLEVLQAKLLSPDAKIRERALFALGNMGSVARPALAAIEKLKEDPEARVAKLAKMVHARVEKGP